MTSIRARLFSILIATTGAVWLAAAAWTFFSTRVEVEQVLDARLLEAARMVSSLVNSQNIQTGKAANAVASIEIQPHAYDRHLSCQIWSLNGSLLSKSEGAPRDQLSSSTAGFSEAVIDGETWKVYAVENIELGVRVLVGDNLRIRDRLVNGMMTGLLLPALLTLPLLAALIWFSVGGGLLPLSKIADYLSHRDASDLSPIKDEQTAAEISPFIKSLNGLFARVARARERERNFTAFAAHELRTPLAGLKTQAQVALASNDPAIREQALSQIVNGVDRTGRLVRQLLDIVSIESGEAVPVSGSVVLGGMLRSIRAELLSSGKHAGDIEIAPELFELRVAMNPDLFRLAARNLMENALLHSPVGEAVQCDLSFNADKAAVISFRDKGTGVQQDELPHLTERFFRGRGKAAVGSGLGLSIAEQALDHAGCSLSLRNGEICGFCAGIVIPANLISGKAV